MRDKFTRLGPTFIKLGQLVSTRPDLFSKEYVKVFGELQDNVPPFSIASVRGVVESEFGRSIDNVFENFSGTPLASASIGQVHLAKLHGSTVAVKIQRPNVKELFDMDLGVVRVLAWLLDKAYSNIEGISCNWTAVLNEYERIMYREIDYRLEGLNGIKFKNNFQNIPWVKVPKVFV